MDNNTGAISAIENCELTEQELATVAGGLVGDIYEIYQALEMGAMVAYLMGHRLANGGVIRKF